MRYILIILCFSFATLLPAQMYRVFYNEPACVEHISMVSSKCDSLLMTSQWLSYSLVQAVEYPSQLLEFSFVDHIEKVVPLTSVSFQQEHKDSLDPKAMDEHRQWQLDTLGYKYFADKNINGKGIVIAVIDAGFTGANESRAFKNIFSEGRVLKTWDFLDNDTTVFDGSTHGTSVWSCIAGNLDGKPTGLATGASFILLRSEDQKTETMADEDRWIQAIEKAYEWGADVVNSSIGFTNVLHSRDQLNGQSLISKAADLATKKGMIVILSAGNEWVTAWKTISIPADAEGVISVGGIDQQGNQSYFSSVGPTADGRTKPDVVAPGTCVVVKGNNFTLASGTSFASPLVAGYMACMLQLKGKGNFTKDSLKQYSGLYPYFDYVFGYGVPQVEKYLIVSPAHYFVVDKAHLTLTCIPTFAGDKGPFPKHIFLKIEDPNGLIKFSKSIEIPKSGIYKIPVTTKQSKFIFGKYYSPQSSDKWTVRWEFSYQEF